MLFIEEGAKEIFKEALDSYYERFEEEMPYFEYISITESDKYDVSIEGAKKLKEFVENLNKPVDVPEDYEERVY